jgi:bifunctional UDP-N-acetylglucosamine pyrophosphorylase/glucosamine-1-phosphate N-acetyltransferase
MKVTGILLAAGQGTRMKSKIPKVLHPIAGRPMIWHALHAIQAATTETPVVVVGVGAQEVTTFLGDSARTVMQDPPLGTGHAVMQAASLLKGQSEHVVVCYSDMPLLRGETLKKMVDTQKENAGPLTLLTVVAQDPRGFGRVVRKKDGTVAAVVEEYVASPEQLQIKEMNVGAYCFSDAWLWDALPRIPLSKKGEYYLTDIVELAVREGLPVQATVIEDLEETIGINTRVHLAEVEAAMRRRINREHMLNGVTLRDPAATYIDVGVSIGQDTLIMPNTYLQGQTRIGESNVIGPDCLVRDSQIGDECTVLASDLEGAVLEDHVHIGPFARLRKGAHLAHGVHMGNFGEVKDSYLAPGVKLGHFSYIGNAQIGARTNIGAGTITCNFDGEKKHPTEIGEDAFIGSDTMLVAPVKIGDRARTGAGAVVTKDVPPDTLVAGMPARAIRKLERKKKP